MSEKTNNDYDTREALTAVGLPEDLHLVVMGARGYSRHVMEPGAGRGRGIWCNVAPADAPSIRDATAQDSMKGLCGGCLRSHAADATRLALEGNGPTRNGDDS